ncbi:S-crystallin 4-like [Clytia hemisphaerica]|uniref:glutathione transferase n=1 Tax=Clytia hemisphaerica TaxID=252671 RepID=A0A7M5UW97_9CNID
MVKYTLNYFDTAGRAESIRLMFHAAGVEFNDNRISGEEWAKNKTDGKRFPLHQMPTLEVDDNVICQSSAIARFVARELGFYGNNSLEQAVIDQVCETFSDIGAELIKIIFGGNDEEAKKTKLQEFYASDKYKLLMGFISKTLKQHNEGKAFIAGEKISIADFVLVGLLCMIELDLKEFPEISALRERVLSIENIKKYMDTQKK